MEMNKSDQYQQDALRTESVDFESIQARLNDPQVLRMLHAAIGLATEAGEALDALKKHIFYGKELDKVNFAEEIGDSQWYAAIGADAVGKTLSSVQDTNIAKLAQRYPEKFDSNKAIHRDLDSERDILESDSDKTDLANQL